jgi:hypothetical protein
LNIYLIIVFIYTDSGLYYGKVRANSCFPYGVVWWNPRDVLLQPVIVVIAVFLSFPFAPLSPSPRFRKKNRWNVSKRKICSTFMVTREKSIESGDLNRFTTAGNRTPPV